MPSLQIVEEQNIVQFVFDDGLVNLFRIGICGWNLSRFMNFKRSLCAFWATNDKEQRSVEKQLASCHLSSQPITLLYFLIVFSKKFEQENLHSTEIDRKRILISYLFESFNVW